MSKNENIPAELKAQRYPSASWLYVVGASQWWRFKRPSPDWVPVDATLLTHPGKRAVLEGCGGFEVWYRLIVEAATQGVDGLFERDPVWLEKRIGLTATGLDILIEAGWLLCLTDEQAQFVRSGGKVTDWGKPPKAAEVTQEPLPNQQDTPTGELGPAETTDPLEAQAAAYIEASAKVGKKVTASELGQFLNRSAATVYRLAAWKCRDRLMGEIYHRRYQEHPNDKVCRDKNDKVAPSNGAEKAVSHESFAHKGKERKEKKRETKEQESKPNGQALASENKARAKDQTSDSERDSSHPPHGVTSDAESENLTESDHGQVRRDQRGTEGHRGSHGPARSVFKRGGDPEPIGACLNPAVVKWNDREAVEFGRRCHQELYHETPPNHQAMPTAPKRLRESVGVWASQWHDGWGPKFNGRGDVLKEAIYATLRKKRMLILKKHNPGAYAMTTIQNFVASFH